jgi:hypothetical protein
VLAESEFISYKLWFDIQSMVLGFTSLVKIKLVRFPGSFIKPAIVNQDVLEKTQETKTKTPTLLLTLKSNYVKSIKLKINQIVKNV